MDTEQRTEWVEGLRSLADFVESTPDFPTETRASVVVLAWTAEKLGQLVKAIGRGEKGAEDGKITFTRRFGPHQIRVIAYSENVCQRVVVGTETVEVEVPPPGVEMVKVTQEREIVKWVCPDSLLALADAEQEAVST